MNETNPYASHSAPPAISPDLMLWMAKRLHTLRLHPPTVLRTLTTWPGTPLLVGFGIVGTFIFWLLTLSEATLLTSHWPIGLACFVAGGALRDFGLARRVAKIWAAQSEFINWEKVDEFLV